MALRRSLPPGPEKLFDLSVGICTKMKGAIDRSRPGVDETTPWPPVSIEQQGEVDQAVCVSGKIRLFWSLLLPPLENLPAGLYFVLLLRLLLLLRSFLEAVRAMQAKNANRVFCS